MNGRQLLRGNTMFGPDRTTSLVLEVWQDSGAPIEVQEAALTVRELRVPSLEAKRHIVVLEAA